LARHFWLFFTLLGSLAVTICLGLFGLIFSLELCVLIVVSVILVTLLGCLVKFFFFVPRPDNISGSRRQLGFSLFNPLNVLKWSNIIILYRYVDASSFPSVHAARAGIFPVVFGHVFGYLGLLLSLPFVALVCYSRIARRRHREWDILAGLVLGLLVSALIVTISGF
jgi:hypothetical protein